MQKFPPHASSNECTHESDDASTSSSGRGDASALYVAAAFACLAGFTNGFNHAALNVVAIRNEWPSSDKAIGLLSTGTLVGATVSSLIAGPVADRAGRRVTATVGETLLLFGVFTAAMAPSVRWLALFEFIKGVGVGTCTTTKCLIVSEMAPPRWRGRVMAVWGLAFSIGGSIPPSLNALLTWRMQILCGAPSAVVMLSLLALSPIVEVAEPSSRDEAGVKADTEADAEADALVANSAPHMQADLISGVAASIPVAIVATVPGSLPYGSYIGLTLDSLGITTEDDARQYLVTTTAISITGTTAALISMSLIDRLGRVRLLLWGGLASILAGTLLGVYLLIAGAPSGSGASVAVPLTLMCLWLFVVKCGPSAVYMVIAAELFPTPVRGQGVGSSIFLQYLIAILLSSLYPRGLTGLGLANLSVGCAVVLIPALLLCHAFVTEERFPRLRTGAPLDL